MPFSMTISRSLAASCLALTLAMPGALAQQAQPAQPPSAYEPKVGQAGKDVVWVPTSDSLVDKMLDVAKVTPSDFVVDLGSGDGRTVIAAAKRGARALGIEYNPDLVELSKRNAEQAGVADRTEFKKADIFETDFSDATVVTLFLLQRLNLQLRPTILEMKPGTRVVSNTFDMGEWTPDQTFEGGPDCTSFCRGHFWVVPAKVDGRWRLPQGSLDLKQNFQMVSGTLTTDRGATPVTGRLDGERLTFKAGETEWTGRVSGDTIEGTAGGQGPWKATRQGA